MDNNQANQAANHGANWSCDHSTCGNTRANTDDKPAVMVMVAARRSCHGRQTQSQAKGCNSNSFFHRFILKNQWFRPGYCCFNG
jgi:hypothetical protein